MRSRKQVTEDLSSALNEGWVPDCIVWAKSLLKDNVDRPTFFAKGARFYYQLYQDAVRDLSSQLFARLDNIGTEERKATLEQLDKTSACLNKPLFPEFDSAFTGWKAFNSTTELAGPDSFRQIDMMTRCDPERESSTEDEDEDDDDDHDMPARCLVSGPPYLVEAASHRSNGLYARNIIDLVPLQTGEMPHQPALSDEAAKSIKELVKTRLLPLGLGLEADQAPGWDGLGAEMKSLLRKLKQLALKDLVEIGKNVGDLGYPGALRMLKSTNVDTEKKTSRFIRQKQANPPMEDSFPSDAKSTEVAYVLDLLRKSGEAESLASRHRKRMAQKDGQKASKFRGASVDWLWTCPQHDSSSTLGVEMGACLNVGAKRSNFTKLGGDKAKLAVLLRDIHSAMCQRIRISRGEDVDGMLNQLIIPGILVNRFRYQLLGLVYVSDGWYALTEIANFEAPVLPVDDLGDRLGKAVATILCFRDLLIELEVDYKTLLDSAVRQPALEGFKFCPADRTH
ncbi:hypothetical protein HK104_000534 [Borealophlyctis nickersoniae]|nr:hypothetical protein HK104_000534 [Borealophlyctis nickersoniae]